MTGVQTCALPILIYYSALPEINTEKEDSTVAVATTNKTSVLQFPHLVLGVIALFLYVGVEVMAGDTIISYGASQQIKLETARYFTTCTLFSMIVGYLIGIVCIPKYFTQQKALVWSAILGVILTIAAILTHGYVSVACIALLGLANSLMWPALWPLALAGLGRFTKIAASLLVMGISGGAIIPPLYGALVDYLHTNVTPGLHPGVFDSYSARYAYMIMVPLYLFILYYSVIGHKAGRSLKVV